MNTLTPILNEKLSEPLYLQLYGYIREAILTGDIRAGEKLPSLRSLAKTLQLSLTTVELAYDQLTVEGYIQSKPQSGYYASAIGGTSGRKEPENVEHTVISDDAADFNGLTGMDREQLSAYYDTACFDFTKWKKCMNRVLTEYTDFLYTEGDPRGEAPLRHEISKYIYQARGVRCQPEQIVIGAGTQQLTGQLCVILDNMGIDYVAFEEPGYLPVRQIFRDRGFKMTTVPVGKEGISIDRLPANIRSAAYVSPSNQFPTGSVMPVARCYELLEWAEQNNSIILEDDYNSELRYFGRAVPSLQGLDHNQRVVYLGSFSSTLFPAIKISYMVLPLPMLKILEEHLSSYTQT
ncbi:MAG: PLP-dependent aminotransferase family protein, partial [Firmicutes bacterium]|nr:PLP-dependent aminotransferase family protein [Bacillota bacterium]